MTSKMAEGEDLSKINGLEIDQSQRQNSQEMNGSAIEVGLSKLKSTLNSFEKASGIKQAGNAEIAEIAENHSCMTSNHDKCLKSKRKNRELGELEDNPILPRLRSDSGNVYSSSMVIETAKNRAEGSTLLALGEEEDYQDLQESQGLQGELINLEMKPCSEGECCKNTAKIVTMIERLQRSVDSIQREGQSQISVNAQIGTDMRKLQGRMSDNEKEMDDLRTELQDYKFQMKLIANVVTRQDQQIQSLTRKLTDAQQREMYPNLVISGIIERPNENTLQAFNMFVQNQLEIQELIPAHRAYRIGQGRTRPIVVELRDPSHQKGKIYNNAGKLKGKVNEEGGKFFITDHLPEQYNEERRRANELFYENKKKGKEDKLNMSIKKGRLLIDDKQYVKAIKVPGPKELFKPDDKQWELADEIDMVKGEEEVKHKSKFVAYAAAVQDLKDVQAAYVKVKTKFASASHVVCAYRLPGKHSPTLQDYTDDGEIGAGRVILNTLKEEKLMNVVIFMIRHFGGQHLGPIRFDLMRKVTQSAIQNLRTKLQEYDEEEANKHQRSDAPRNQPPAVPSEKWADWDQAQGWSADENIKKTHKRD